MIWRSCGGDLGRTTIVVLFVAASLLLGLLVAPAQAATTPGTVYGTAGMTGLAGEVRSPEGVGLDPIRGRVALPDYINNRVSIFRADGTFLFAFGKDVNPAGGTGPEVCTTTTGCKAGVQSPEAGAVSDSYEAEYAPSGKRIFVAEDGNRRVSVFSAAGEFLYAFGKDVIPGGGTGPEICTTATGCQTGSYDGSGGGFADVWPITFGPDGLVYISDYTAGRIDVFNPAGTWVRSFGRDVITGGGTGFEVCEVAADCKSGETSGADGALNFPEGLDFAPDGRLWVSTSGGHQVWVFDTDPLAPVATFGKDVIPGGATGFEVCTDPPNCKQGVFGNGPGELASPNGVGIGADGIAYVASASDNRVNAYEEDFDPLFAFGADVIPGGGVGFEVCTTTCGSGLASPSVGFDSPYGVAVDCRGIVYVTNDSNDPDPARAHGEPGAKPGPCKLKARGAKLNKRKGTAELKALVPYPAKVTLSGKNLKRASAKHRGLEGTEKLAVKPKGKLKKQLRRKGRAKVKAKLKMAPSDGNVVQTATKKLKLKRAGR